MNRLIEGRAIAERVYAELRGEIAQLKERGRTPGLAVVLVGDNPASRAYVRAKDKMCRDLGLHSVKLELPADTTQVELLQRVHELNRRSRDPWHPRPIAAAKTDRRSGDRARARSSQGRRRVSSRQRGEAGAWRRLRVCSLHPAGLPAFAYRKAGSRFPAPTLWFLGGA